MNKFYRSLSLAFALAAASLAGASDIVYSYGNLKASPQTFGTQRVDDYDVAILLDDPSITGSKITKISVPFPSDANASGMRMWLSKELTLASVDGKKQTVPDIVSIPATVSDNRMTVTLDEPYTLDGEPVYVGYSFDITSVGGDSDNFPVAMYVGDGAEGGFMMRTRRKMLKWQSVVSQSGGVSGIEVTLQGDFDKTSCSFAGPGILDCSYDADSFEVNTTFTNFCSESIETLEYTYSLNGAEALSGTYEYDVPQYAQFGRPVKLKLDVPNQAVEGENLLHMELTKVNGKPNENPHNAFDTKVYMFEVLPVKRPLLEEYTAFWCGNCTRGYAALEHMNAKYPDRFIGVSIHNGDELELLSTDQFPKSVSGFPGAWMDREYECDPYGGRAYRGFNIENDWLSQCEQFCPVKVDVDACMREDGSGIVDATASVTYIRETDKEARVFFYLLSDGLYDKRWRQTNYYTSANYPMEIREMDQFTKDNAYYVSGLVWNDILAMTSNVCGEPGSLPEPAQIEPRKKMLATYEFDTSKAWNGKGVNLVKDATRLRVVAGVVETESGRIINCGVGEVKGWTSSLGSLVDEGHGRILSTECYSLDGIRVDKAGRGLYIQVTRFEDGYSSVRKIAL